MLSEWEEVEIRCRSEFAYAQEPRTIGWADGRWEEVAEVLSTRRAPDGSAFLVRIGDDVLELRYLDHQDRWQARRRELRRAAGLAQRQR